ncbi:hypothetical protein BAUCODRAFT_35415 [Baudoinia panamericana UAMH 10762]|uniref:Uncharacterized protein n=1 Tax=Baudoinia panamericana (strain UAMH 10762) TaxID=717646 RepID=M2LM89_BAUPA|nr:uncharacterized protein BAUCODRAFT_35415 [Baudoinia panamericana UAMH 10762]EMC95432.1 hypothetical protein BAUCODRAFT_35415 [Baudoinia panamericana UAMH 10762]
MTSFMSPGHGPHCAGSCTDSRLYNLPDPAEDVRGYLLHFLVTTFGRALRIYTAMAVGRTCSRIAPVRWVV